LTGGWWLSRSAAEVIKKQETEIKCVSSFGDLFAKKRPITLGYEEESISRTAFM